MDRQVTARGQLREWIRSKEIGADEVCIPDLTQQAVDHFMQDPQFLSVLLSEILRPWIYEECQNVIARTRSVPVFAEPSSEPGLETPAPRFRFLDWLEHANGRHIRLRAMTKIDLQAAIEERQVRIDTEKEVVEFLKRIERRLTSPDVRVADVFTEDQLKELRERCQKRSAKRYLKEAA